MLEAKVQSWSREPAGQAPAAATTPRPRTRKRPPGTVPDWLLFLTALCHWHVFSFLLQLLVERGDARLPAGAGRGAVHPTEAEDVHLHEDPPRAGKVHVLRLLPLPRLLPLRLHLSASPVLGRHLGRLRQGTRLRHQVAGNEMFSPGSRRNTSRSR